MFLYITHNYPYQICIEKPSYIAFVLFFLLAYVLGAQRNRLIESLLPTLN